MIKMFDDPIERKRKELRNDHARALMANTKPSEGARKHMEHDLPYFSKPEWGKWIQCKTGRKPKEASLVLVRFSGRSENQVFKDAPAIAAWFADDGWVLETVEPLITVTVDAWMPLPPMKGEEA